MKKLILLFLVASMASCIAPWNTRHQYKTMRDISRPHNYVGRHVSPRERGDYNHPAVHKQTRKTLYGRQYYINNSNNNFSTLGTWYRPHEK